MTEINRASIGAIGEQLAAEHLRRRGFAIVERNYRTRWGELDIIACDGDTLVFAEVKARLAHAVPANPFDSIHPRKRRQVRRMAGRWLSERVDRPRARELRFDAIGVLLDTGGRLIRLDHVEAAF